MRVKNEKMIVIVISKGEMSRGRGTSRFDQGADRKDTTHYVGKLVMFL